METFKVVLYSPDTHIIYDGRTPDASGVGGSEMSRIRLLRALAGRNHDVTALVNCNTSGVIDGVSYKPLREASAIQCDVLIGVTAGGALSLEPLADIEKNARLTLIRIGGTPKPEGIARINPDFLYVNSNFLRRHVVQSWNFPSRKVFVCYPGLDQPAFREAEKLQVARDPFSLVYIGHPSKGLVHSIDVLRLLRSFDTRFHMDVFGGEELWGGKTSLAVDEPGVCYRGTVGQRELIPRLFEYSYMVSIPETPEGFGNAMQEARRAGVIVLACPYGAFPEMIRQGETGFLLDDAPVSVQVEQAAGIILELSQWPEQVERIRAAGMRSTLDWELSARTHEAHWRLLLGDGAALSRSKAPCAECGGEPFAFPDGPHCMSCGRYEPPQPAGYASLYWPTGLSRKIISLRTTLREIKRANQHLQSQIEGLQSELRAREKATQSLEAQSIDQVAGIEWLKGEVEARQKELDEIYKSRAWRAVDMYRRMRRKLGRRVRVLAHPAPESNLLQGDIAKAKSSFAGALLQFFDDPVSIVIVTYNNLSCTRQCIQSVLHNSDARNLQVVVVDNHSSDETPAYLKEVSAKDARIKILLNETNAGFAAANNQGIAQATGDIIVLLNNDTIVPPGWLSRLVDHLRDPAIGLVGPLTNFAGNEARIETAYTDINSMQSFAAGLMQTRAGDLADIHMLAMFCVAFRRSVFTQVGQLDERFGIGMFEDDDYSHRVRAAGFRVVCAGDVFVHHYGQAAFGTLIQTGAYDRLFERNRQLFEEKWNVHWRPHQHGILEFTKHQRPPSYEQQLEAEARKWGSHLEVEASGERNAWLDHPLIHRHYEEKSKIDGLPWEQWIRKRLGRAAVRCLSLGCGAGSRSFELYSAGAAASLEGCDISSERVAEAEKKRRKLGIPGQFSVLDVNKVVLEEGAYDLIFSSHSFHHFLELEHVMEQVQRGLSRDGLFVLEEFVGPTQFQWTELQMEYVHSRLAAAPERLRRYRNGLLKVAEGKPSPRDVIALSPFESIRSSDIVPLFHRYFRVERALMLGGTLQQLLYNGIIHNFDEEDPEAREYLQETLELEDHLIETGAIPSDFQLLIGTR